MKRLGLGTPLGTSLRIVLGAALGLAVTVVIAWCSAWYAAHPGRTRTSVEVDASAHPPPRCACEGTGSVVTPEGYQVLSARGWWMTQLDWSRRPYVQGARLLPSPVTVYRVGWPLRALEWSALPDGMSAQQPESFRTTG